MATEQIEVRNRWTNRVQFTAEITCSPDASIGVKLGLAVRWGRDNGADLRGAVLRGAVLRGAVLSDAVLSGADLRDAVLSGADLSDADLRDAVLSGADLRDAVLSGADLRDAVLSGGSAPDWVPRIASIHQAVFEAASADGALDMGTWHRHGDFCGTAHCRAGWVTHLAGPAGRVLDAMMGTAGAAALIYQASDPKLERVPNFYATNEEALADMERLAAAEREVA